MQPISSSISSLKYVSEFPSSHGTGCSFTPSVCLTRIAAQNLKNPTIRRYSSKHTTCFAFSVVHRHTVRARLRRRLPAPLCSSGSQADDDSGENQELPASPNDAPETSPSPEDGDGPQSPELSSLLSQLSGLISTTPASSDSKASPTESPKTPKLYSHLDQLPKNPPSPPSAPAPSTSPSPPPSVPAPSLTTADKTAILASLAILTESITCLSASLESVSSNVRLLANAVQGSGELEAPGRQNAEQAEGADSLQEAVRQVEANTPDPWGGSAAATSDPAQHLVFQIQRAFVQARIIGLGKPPEVAMSDFIDACMAGREGGVDLPNMQLKLILMEGSLPPHFSLSPPSGQPNPFIAEEGRIRAIWIRFIYVALDYVQGQRNRISQTTSIGAADNKKGDPMDNFVIQTLELAVNDGRTYEMVQAEHTEEGPAGSQATQMMRQSQSLILMTLKKATSI